MPTGKSAKGFHILKFIETEKEGKIVVDKLMVFTENLTNGD